jgi:glycosyltransferase involved in cell wall biosynthesis
MRIFHLFSDWKWTGPAEPVLDLCAALQRRGHDVAVAYRLPPFDVFESVDRGIRERELTGTTEFALVPLSKLQDVRHLRRFASDVRHIARFIDSKEVDILNVHHSHDHIVGGLAARLARRTPPVIRTDHARDSLKNGWLSRWFISRYTDGVITFSEHGRRHLIERLGFRSDQIRKASTAIDCRKFGGDGRYKNMRPVFGIPDNVPVIGIVARFQRYRRTDVLLEAMALLVKHVPDVRLLLVGHSSQMKTSVIEPIRRLGIASNVILTGYRRIDHDYIDTMASMDIFVLLTPGSDGTARAVREALALGKPVVVTKRGILPELVENGVTGFVVDETPADLFRALLFLLRDDDVRRRMGSAARRAAVEKFSLERQAEQVEHFYAEILERHGAACRDQE